MAHSVKNIRELVSSSDYWGWVEGLYLAKNDCAVAMRLRDGQPYEPESRKLWRSLCADAELVVDVGAHTGIYSLDAWQAGAKGVMSVEPYHMNYARLVMNLRHGGFSSASCVFCAASDREAVELFTVRTPNHYCSTGGRLGRKSQVDAVEYAVVTRCLDTLVREAYYDKVRAIKIDTEKHGVRVLRGMAKLLACRPDLILECTEDGLTEVLKPLGYRFYKIKESSGLEEVADLTPDAPFTFESPNRYATVRKI